MEELASMDEKELENMEEDDPGLFSDDELGEEDAVLDDDQELEQNDMLLLESSAMHPLNEERHDDRAQEQPDITTPPPDTTAPPPDITISSSPITPPSPESSISTNRAIESKSPKNKPKKKEKETTSRGSTRANGGLFVHERALVALNLKKLRAIRRRAPVQVRIFTQPRRVRTPFDNYVCAPSEVVCSDIFWSALLGDMLRLRHLVLVEGIAIDITSDPWLMHQTPLHWAAKGGSLEAIEFLLSHGANVYTKDDNGSIPLHLACWAGHTEAAIELLKAGDLKDLLIADYDANLNSLEWAAVRGHTKCVRELTKYTDTVWLPSFIQDLIWKIILKTKMKSPEEKAQEAKLAAQRAEYQRLQALAEQAKKASQFGEAVVLDSSDAAKVDFSQK